MDKPKPGIRIEAGTPLEITTGAFAGIPAQVAEVWSGEEVVKATATIFGRPVQLELSAWSLQFLPREDTWPEKMPLRRMLASVEHYATERQLRLFAVACCRRIWPLMSQERCAKLIEERERFGTLDDWGPWSATFLMRTLEVVERHAEGADGAKELEKASDDADWLYQVKRDYCACRDESWGPVDQELMTTCEAARAVCEASRTPLHQYEVAVSAARAVFHANGGSEDVEGHEQIDPAETAAQRDLVRDVFGRPLRLTAIDPTWLTPTVTRLAQCIYDGRAFDEMPILGDALEDAGCADETVLAHCRGSGPHVRGCWVLDLLLDKS